VDELLVDVKDHFGLWHATDVHRLDRGHMADLDAVVGDLRPRSIERPDRAESIVSLSGLAKVAAEFAPDEKRR